jgi:hypothetical protein
MTVSFKTTLGEKNGFSYHNSFSLRGITESVNISPPNTGLEKYLKEAKTRFLSAFIKRISSIPSSGTGILNNCRTQGLLPCSKYITHIFLSCAI